MRTLLTPTVESELELELDGRTLNSLLYNILLCSPLCMCVCVFAVVLLVLLLFSQRFPTLSLQFIAVVC